MPPTNSGPSPGGQAASPQFNQALADCLLDKSKGEGNESGTYRRNLKRDVERFIDWWNQEYDHELTFDGLGPQVCRSYIRFLVREGYADGTVRTYYANFSAFVGWAEREELLDEHVAQTTTATEPLPEDDGRRSGDQQAWTSEERQQLTRHVHQEASAALDDVSENYWDALQAQRDRAVAVVLCYSGIRAGELFKHPSDDRRTGITWGDVNLEEGRVTVLSKKQQWDDRSLPDQTHHALAMLERVLDPGDEDWPVFPTLHRPTLYDDFRDALEAEGVDRDRADALLNEEPVFDLYRKYDLNPRALRTDGARRVLKRLCEAASIEPEQGDYLEPHGGRRGVGEVMVRTHGYAAAARMLDNSERMVRERYSHIEAGELADEATVAFEEADSE